MSTESDKPPTLWLFFPITLLVIALWSLAMFGCSQYFEAECEPTPTVIAVFLVVIPLALGLISFKIMRLPFMLATLASLVGWVNDPYITCGPQLINGMENGHLIWPMASLGMISLLFCFVVKQIRQPRQNEEHKGNPDSSEVTTVEENRVANINPLFCSPHDPDDGPRPGSRVSPIKVCLLQEATSEYDQKHN
jgi:hypothetical protein